MTHHHRSIHAFLVAAAAAAVAGCVPAASGGGSTTPPHHLTDDEIAAIPSVFPTTLVPPTHAAFAPMYARLTELHNPELVGQLVSTLIILDGRDIPVTVEECDEVDAHYQPSTHSITICYEFIADVNRLLGKPEDEWGNLDQDTGAVVIFTALHEMGHALVDVLDLPVHGNEEDAADQFAFLMLTKADDMELVNRIMVAPAAFFHHHGIEQDADGGPAADDEHSASSQRAFEAVCLLYGRHRDAGVGEALGDRASDCIAHTASVVDTWNRFLAPYSRIDTGRTF